MSSICEELLEQMDERLDTFDEVIDVMREKLGREPDHAEAREVLDAIRDKRESVLECSDELVSACKKGSGEEAWPEFDKAACDLEESLESYEAEA